MALSSFNVHNIRTLRVRPALNTEGRWIDIFVNNEDQEIMTLFFVDKGMALAVADAINIACGNARAEELEPAED